MREMEGLRIDMLFKGQVEVEVTRDTREIIVSQSD